MSCAASFDSRSALRTRRFLPHPSRPLSEGLFKIALFLPLSPAPSPSTVNRRPALPAPASLTRQRPAPGGQTRPCSPVAAEAALLRLAADSGGCSRCPTTTTTTRKEQGRASGSARAASRSASSDPRAPATRRSGGRARGTTTCWLRARPASKPSRLPGPTSPPSSGTRQKAARRTGEAGAERRQRRGKGKASVG